MELQYSVYCKHIKHYRRYIPLQPFFSKGSFRQISLESCVLIKVGRPRRDQQDTQKNKGPLAKKEPLHIQVEPVPDTEGRFIRALQMLLDAAAEIGPGQPSDLHSPTTEGIDPLKKS
ncbi:MAG: hypothetical protein KCHDKBKB_01075 [Elusimicrobia bacterium]|nr:hypothetical protein [Elusimicrobiota bacterium]